jgi:hypothetical protein
VRGGVPEGEAVLVGDVEFFGGLGDDVVGDPPVVAFEVVGGEEGDDADEGGDELGVVEVFGFDVGFDDDLAEVLHVVVAAEWGGTYSFWTSWFSCVFASLYWLVLVLRRFSTVASLLSKRVMRVGMGLSAGNLEEFQVNSLK